ncbi:unnamed protein product [Thelazia callipaeda]|uniref:PID domain-containing protein n=1 Tax=Thelazia callipaeda TaxID=103827 RepID=A0A0N5CKW0_THECL|nr:unnamed protein product [Thelazia callipaeda]
MSTILSSSSPQTFYRTLLRLTERKKKQKAEGLTNNQSNSDETVSEYSSSANINSNLSQQQQQQGVMEETQGACEATQPKSNVVHRGMDKIRRSVRESFRRRMSRQHIAGGTSSTRHSPTRTTDCAKSGKAELWQPDEATVRNGTCSFHVKYLGGIEVFESRGMQICEGALKLLKGQRRRPIKAILYVSGDGLRVVDQESSRGLIVDQTIEKVSFCAPDRSNEKGFAYICRDGTSRRWMCHGFNATKESGERLSHAVGCAFAICLERKKKRDMEAAAAVQAAAGLSSPGSGKRSSVGFTLNGIVQQAALSNTSFERNTSNNSFRRLSITERLQDPQTAIIQQPPSVATNLASELQITPKPRPIGNPLLFERQGSLRAPTSLSTSSFRRQFSLRSCSDSPIKRQQTLCVTTMGKSEPIFEDDEDKNWLNSNKQNQEGYFESAPYNPVKYSGIRQSLSYTAVPSTNTVDSSNTRVCKSVNSPLQVLRNWKSNMNKSESWLSNPISMCPSTAKSKADEWLEQTLRSSLSLSSPYKNICEIEKINPVIDKDVSNHPFLSIPASSSYPTVTQSEKQTTVHFNSDFSHYQLSPITENSVSFSKVESDLKTKTVLPSTLTVNSDVDVFGQPVFSPSFANPHLQVKSGETVNNERTENEESDPFDVRWSQIAVDTAASYHPASFRSTNPFYSESSAVKI